jgi:ankyrin repeat protein
MTKEWKDAVRLASIDELERLLIAGADSDARDEHGQAALMLAAAGGHRHIVECLIRHGADLNHTAKYGLSALMLAVVNGHAEVVRMLVRAGADHELRGTGASGFAGKTALDLALARDETEMMEILRARAGDAC